MQQARWSPYRSCQCRCGCDLLRCVQCICKPLQAEWLADCRCRTSFRPASCSWVMDGSGLQQSVSSSASGWLIWPVSTHRRSSSEDTLQHASLKSISPAPLWRTQLAARPEDLLYSRLLGSTSFSCQTSVPSLQYQKAGLRKC